MSGAGSSHVFHASSVAIAGRGVLILGPSGAGKSSLALNLVALGAGLVADDATRVAHSLDHLVLSRPNSLPPWIEARGVGLLRVPCVCGPVPLALVIDLGQDETARLPPERVWTGMALPVPLLHRGDPVTFPAAIWLFMHHGRIPSEQCQP